MPEITCFMFFLHGIVPLFNYNKETDKSIYDKFTNKNLVQI